MRGVVCAFRSDAEVVVEWWEESNRRHQAWHQSAKEFREQYPDRDVYQRDGLRGGKRVVGIGGKESPGEGWRWSKRLGYWLPDKRYKAGKAHAAELAELQFELDLMPGMPDTAMTGNKWHHPGVQKIDGTVWVTWGCSADEVRESQWSVHGVDDDLWVEAPLSEFYLAVEDAA